MRPARTPSPVILLAGLLLCAGVTPALPAAPAGTNAGSTAPAAPADTAFTKGLGDIQALIKKRQYADSEARSRELLTDVQKREGASSRSAAQVQDLLAESLWRGGKPTEALPIIQQALLIKIREYSATSLEVATSLNTEAAARNALDQFPQAARLWERVLQIRMQRLGPEDPDVARAWNNLGVVYQSMGQFDQARKAHLASLTIKEKSLGPESIEVSNSLNNMGTVCTELAQLDEAIAYHERALAIRRKSPAASPANVAAILNSLGTANRDKGQYVRALEVLEESLALYEKAEGPAGEGVAFACTNLGVLYQRLGDMEKAGDYYRRALQIREKRQSPSQLSQSLENMAVYESRVDSLALADSLAQRALKLRQKLYGDHAFTASTLGVLGGIRLARGDTAEARRLTKSAWDMNRKTLGATHAKTAAARVAYGNLLAITGQFAAGRQEVLAGAQSLESTLGPANPTTAGAWLTYAALLSRHGQNREALSIALKAERGSRESLRLVAQSLSEEESRLYAARRRNGLDLALSLLAQEHNPPTALVRSVWNEVVQSRCMVLDEQIWRNRILALSPGPRVTQARADLMRAASKLSNLLLTNSSGSQSQPRAQSIAQARTNRDRAERVLARLSAEDRRFAQRRTISLGQVQKSLHPGEALVAYVRYRQATAGSAEHPSMLQDDLAAPESSGGPRQDGFAYGVFVAPRGTSARFIPLDTAGRVDTLVAGWRRCVTNQILADTAHVSPPSVETTRAGQALVEAVISPLQSHFSTRAQIYIVPDGALNTVSWAALPAWPNARQGSSEPNYLYLSAERDLVPVGTRPPSGRGALLVGGVDYDAPEYPDSASPFVTNSGTSTNLIPIEFDCSDLSHVFFHPLPGTRQEIHFLAEGLLQPATRQANAPVELLEGATATEAAFKHMAPGKAMIHLATHGFFLDGSCPAYLPTTRSMNWIAGKANAPRDSLTQLRHLPLCGLAFAGANHFSTTQISQDDGILTPDEVASLSLQGVQSVILSACDSGLGSLETWEGQVGLRRAFQEAGARSVAVYPFPQKDLGFDTAQPLASSGGHPEPKASSAKPIRSPVTITENSAMCFVALGR